MECCVYLEGNADTLQWLADHCSKGGMRVLRSEQRYYLVSEALHAVEDLDELHSRASALADELAGVVLVHDPDRAKPIRISGIERVKADGSRNFIVYPDSTLLVNPFDVTADRIADLALEDANVAEVLRYLGQEPTWGWFTNIIDIILRDTKGRGAAWWDEQGDLELLKRTANNPALAGFGSRHGVQQGDSPHKAVSFKKARWIVFRLVRQWLRWVNEGRPEMDVRGCVV